MLRDLSFFVFATRATFLLTAELGSALGQKSEFKPCGTANVVKAEDTVQFS